MPSARAASSALWRSREAIAVAALPSPFCIAGMTFLTAIVAAPRTPQRTLLDIADYHSRKFATKPMTKKQGSGSSLVVPKRNLFDEMKLFFKKRTPLFKEITLL